MEHKSPAMQAANWLQGLSTLWAILIFLFPALGALVTGWLARLEAAPVPWHLVIFYSTGVFAFLTISAMAWVRAGWEQTLKHKLTCDDFSLQIVSQGQNKVGVMLSSYFNNLSHMPIEVTLHDVSISLQGKTTTQEIDEKELNSIAANSFIPITWPLVTDIDIKDRITGFIKYTARYGVAGKKRNRTLTEKFRINITITKDREGYSSFHAVGTELQVYS